MLKLLKAFTAAVVAVAAVGVAVPVAASASKADVMACSVSVVYSLNNVDRMTYVKDFEVDPETPFSDDASTFFRIKWFDASMTRLSGDAVVSISFFGEVSTFNQVDIATSLKVKDESHGETTESNTSFYSGIGVIGSHNTRYSLTCKSAKD